MFSVLIVIHVIICICLMIVVLMQSAKGEGLAGAFGGGGGALSGAVFGGRGAATFLSRATTVLAILFMLSCIVLTVVSKGRTEASMPNESAVEKAASQQQQLPATTTPQTQPATGQGQQPAGNDVFDEGQTQQQSSQQQSTQQQPAQQQPQQPEQPSGGGGE